MRDSGVREEFTKVCEEGLEERALDWVSEETPVGQYHTTGPPWEVLSLPQFGIKWIRKPLSQLLIPCHFCWDLETQSCYRNCRLSEHITRQRMLHSTSLQPPCYHCYTTTNAPTADLAEAKARGLHLMSGFQTVWRHASSHTNLSCKEVWEM